MSVTVATSEPRQARAGETWVWDRVDLPDYPSSPWTLKYAFKKADGHFEATAATNGSGYRVTISAATSEAYDAGVYQWVAWVESGGEKYGVGAGVLEVLPCFAQTTAASVDARSHARKMVEAIEALLESRASVDQMEYQIQGRMLKRMPIKDLLAWRDYYRGELHGEQLACDAAQGRDSNRLVVRL